MAEGAWYVPAMAEWIGPPVNSHVIRCGVPDDVYDIPNAWSQEEAGLGVFKITFREGVTLTARQKANMRSMGCRPVGEGPITETSLRDRRGEIARLGL